MIQGSSLITGAVINTYIADWAEPANTDPIPDSKIPASIARDSEVTTAVAAGTEGWAKPGDATAIPADKLTNAPSGGGGGTTYTPGDGIDFAGNVISIEGASRNNRGGVITADEGVGAADAGIALSPLGANNKITAAINAEIVARNAAITVAVEDVETSAGDGINISANGEISLELATGGNRGGVTLTSNANAANTSGSGVAMSPAGVDAKIAAIPDETFTGLPDTPASFGTAGQQLVVNPAGTGLAYATPAAGGGGGVDYDAALVDVNNEITLAAQQQVHTSTPYTITVGTASTVIGYVAGGFGGVSPAAPALVEAVYYPSNHATTSLAARHVLALTNAAVANREVESITIDAVTIQMTRFPALTANAYYRSAQDILNQFVASGQTKTFQVNFTDGTHLSSTVAAGTDGTVDLFTAKKWLGIDGSGEPISLGLANLNPLVSFRSLDTAIGLPTGAETWADVTGLIGFDHGAYTSSGSNNGQGGLYFELGKNIAALPVVAVGVNLTALNSIAFSYGAVRDAGGGTQRWLIGRSPTNTLLYASADIRCRPVSA